jgi:hypothetical protein
VAVYVDDMKAHFGPYVMCHMIADTTEELLAMCATIGVQAKWIQHPGTPLEHFDIAQTKRRLAVAAGAKEISWRAYASAVRRRERTGSLGLSAP